MSREDLEEHIREELQKPTTIDGDDLSPLVCTWCGDGLGHDVEVVVWDIPEIDNKSVVYRYRYCSDACRRSDREAVMRGAEDMHRYGDPERLSAEDREVLE